jgi:predicted ATPase
MPLADRVDAGAVKAVLVSDSRKLVYVSGAPGSGKTSLAVPLAAALGYALLAKDRIKETLHDALGAPGPDLAWSRRLGGAAMETAVGTGGRRSGRGDRGELPAPQRV